MRSGERQHTHCLVLQSLVRANDGEDIRVGYTVTKKMGNAVVRNRIKRRLRAAVQISMAQNGLCGHDHVLIGKRAALHSKFDTIVDELSNALNSTYRKLPKKNQQAGIQNGQ